MNSILVFGASGTVGAPLVRALLNRGEKVKAVSRTGQAPRGAEGVRLEFGKDTEFACALADIDRLFLLLPSGKGDAVGTLSPLITAAAARDIKIVYLSAFGAGEHPDHEHAKIERTCGLPFVSLRPNWFSDNFHTFWKSDVLQGNLRLPAADGKSSFIDARDIATCAVEALTTGKFDGRAIELTGPDVLDYRQAAEILSAATGKTITYTPLSPEEYVRVHTSEGMSEHFAKGIAEFFAPVRAGEYAVVTDGVFEMTGVHSRTLAVYANDHVSDLLN